MTNPVTIDDKLPGIPVKVKLQEILYRYGIYTNAATRGLENSTAAEKGLSATGAIDQIIKLISDLPAMQLEEKTENMDYEDRCSIEDRNEVRKEILEDLR